MQDNGEQIFFSILVFQQKNKNTMRDSVYASSLVQYHPSLLWAFGIQLCSVIHRKPEQQQQQCGNQPMYPYYGVVPEDVGKPTDGKVDLYTSPYPKDTRKHLLYPSIFGI